MKNVEFVCVLMWAHADSKEQAGLVKRSHMPKKAEGNPGAITSWGSLIIQVRLKLCLPCEKRRKRTFKKNKIKKSSWQLWAITETSLKRSGSPTPSGLPLLEEAKLLPADWPPPASCRRISNRWFWRFIILLSHKGLLLLFRALQPLER